MSEEEEVEHLLAYHPDTYIGKYVAVPFEDQCARCLGFHGHIQIYKGKITTLRN